MSAPASSDRAFVRTFFTSPTAVDADDSATMLRKAAQLRGMQAPDVWVPDNEDATAPSMRQVGVENTIEVVAEHGGDFPGEIHPRVVWHRDDPSTRFDGFEMMRQIADPGAGAGEHIDGFVIPEVGDVDDWKKADEFFTIIEHEHGLEEGSLAMSVIVESAQAELALGELRHEAAKPTNNLERLFMLIDGEVDYTKDMRAITPSGQLPPWPELRHNTSRGASANGLIAVDGPFDDIRNVEGYHARMTENQAKGQLGIWALTPGQVVEANTSPLPPQSGSWRLAVAGEGVDLREDGDASVYDGDDLVIEETGDGYVLRGGNREQSLDHDELVEELVGRATYIPSMTDIVESMEAFEVAKEAGRGAIAMAQETTVRVGDVAVEISADRMWDEATYQAAQTPISLFQDVYENRPDQHDELADRYGENVVERAMNVG